MPSVEIQTNLVTIKLEANEIAVQVLGEQALDLLARSVAALPPRSEVGFASGNQHIDRRSTYDGHEPINAGGAR